MRAVFLFLLILSPCLSLAYIPEYRMIMSRTADNHGHGIYEIDQDVIFRTEPEPLTVHETWYVDGENSLRLQAEGRGALLGLLKIALVFKGNQKLFIDTDGTFRTTKTSPDWFEPFFNFRLSKNIKPLLVAMSMAPAASLNDRRPHKSGTSYTYEPEDFVRLARVGGGVSYAIGKPGQPGEASSPGLWIEQDQFVVRKLRLPSSATITANEYIRHPNSYWLAKIKNITWGTRSAEIRVNQVKSHGKTKSIQNLLDPSSLQQQKTPLLLPQQEVVREFYTRFR